MRVIRVCTHFRDNEVMHRTLIILRADLVDTGQLTEEQAQVHPQSNILIGCLGMDEDPPTPLHTASTTCAQVTC